MKAFTLDNHLKRGEREALRATPAYIEAIRLLQEKKELQAKLRGVDKMLRELEILAAGVITIARYDIDHDYPGKPLIFPPSWP